MVASPVLFLFSRLPTIVVKRQILVMVDACYLRPVVRYCQLVPADSESEMVAGGGGGVSGGGHLGMNSRCTPHTKSFSAVDAHLSLSPVLGVEVRCIQKHDHWLDVRIRFDVL